MFIFVSGYDFTYRRDKYMSIAARATGSTLVLAWDDMKVTKYKHPVRFPEGEFTESYNYLRSQFFPSNRPPLNTIDGDNQEVSMDDIIPEIINNIKITSDGCLDKNGFNLSLLNLRTLNGVINSIVLNSIDSVSTSLALNIISRLNCGRILEFDWVYGMVYLHRRFVPQVKIFSKKIRGVVSMARFIVCFYIKFINDSISGDDPSSLLSPLVIGNGFNFSEEDLRYYFRYLEFPTNYSGEYFDEGSPGNFYSSDEEVAEKISRMVCGYFQNFYDKFRDWYDNNSIGSRIKEGSQVDRVLVFSFSG